MVGGERGASFCFLSGRRMVGRRVEPMSARSSDFVDLDRAVELVMSRDLNWG
jgi:hypothetical protein